MNGTPAAGGKDRAVDGLSVDGLQVRFGGLVAVDGLTLSVPVGRITGLIGPNGAGKTTTFNAITGLVRPAEGQVRLFGDDVTSLPPQARAQRGLGRTFQRIELFESLSVRDNVALGREAGMAGSKPWRCLRATRAESRSLAGAVADSLESCGISDLAEAHPPDLSTGQRRLVELARVIAGDFRVLLLDEPSSGLDKTETLAFGLILTHLVADRGVGILIVEHDMALVMSVCQYIHVLDFGRPVFEGTPGEVSTSGIVRAAYLGGEGLVDPADALASAGSGSY